MASVNNKVIPFDPIERNQPKTPSSAMNSELVEQASEKISDPQILINLVSKRTKEITSGKSPLVNVEPGMTHSDIALLEIIEEKVTPIINDIVYNQ